MGTTPKTLFYHQWGMKFSAYFRYLKQVKVHSFVSLLKIKLNRWVKRRKIQRIQSIWRSLFKPNTNMGSFFIIEENRTSRYRHTSFYWWCFESIYKIWLWDDYDLIIEETCLSILIVVRNEIFRRKKVCFDRTTKWVGLTALWLALKNHDSMDTGSILIRNWVGAVTKLNCEQIYWSKLIRYVFNSYVTWKILHH